MTEVISLRVIFSQFTKFPYERFFPSFSNFFFNPIIAVVASRDDHLLITWMLLYAYK